MFQTFEKHWNWGPFVLKILWFVWCVSTIRIPPYPPPPKWQELFISEGCPWPAPRNDYVLDACDLLVSL